jgi:hypothetical protein
VTTRSFHALPTASVQNKNPCANKFTLDGLLMEVAGANADCAFVSAFAVDSFGGVAQLATLGGVAGFSLTAIASFLVGQRLWLDFLGGLFLCYLGVRTFISKPAERAAEVRGSGLFSASEV